MKVALVYDRVNKWGGAERVLLSLHKIFPDAPLYTSVYNKEKAPWAEKFNIKTSFLQNLPNASNVHEVYAFAMPIVFESFSFDKYDLVISVTSESAKGIITKPHIRHICICLTPTRYLWSGYKTYFKNELMRVLSAPAITYLRKWDKIASDRPDELIAISQTVKRRISKYYSKGSRVIYPAVDKLKNPTRKLEEEYFLVVSRLVSYKRIDLAIRAANTLKLPLKIVGVGHEMKKLKSIAGDTVEFLGMVSDQELSNLYNSCRAVIFPGVEDFGIVIVEAQLAGKPVIAFEGGGATEIIRSGKTGVFFEKQTVKSLVETLQAFNEKRYNKVDCQKNAERFSFERFKKELMDFILKEVNKS